MTEASIPVDLFNPGQVFACLGLAEATAVLVGPPEAYFCWADPNATRFHLRVSGEEDPVLTVLQFLDRASARAEAPFGSANIDGWLPSWGPTPAERPRFATYPAADPASPATLVAVLSDGTQSLVIDHWADTERDNVKFWAGAGGYPGAALTRDSLKLVDGRAASFAGDPFALAVPQSSSFRLDWRRDYVPIDAGFSLNNHGDSLQTVGYPLVELLAAIGLTHARPQARSKTDYRYGVLGSSGGPLWFPLSFHRAALGSAPLPFETRLFRMSLGWPGKEGQARAITHVTEGERP